jgi:hypothetical protein
MSEPVPQWLSDAERAEVIDVLSKVGGVPTAGLARGDEEAIDEARALRERLIRNTVQPPQIVEVPISQMFEQINEMAEDMYLSGVTNHDEDQRLQAIFDEIAARHRAAPTKRVSHADKCKIEHLQRLLSCAYQLAGVVGAPVRFLDAFSRHEGDIDTLLPVSIEECDEFTKSEGEASRRAGVGPGGDVRQNAAASGPLRTSQPLRVCEWTTNDPDVNIWATDCGETFLIESGTPENNSMRFCCFCGARCSSGPTKGEVDELPSDLTIE